MGLRFIRALGAVVVLAASLLTGCASHQPRPTDPRASIPPPVAAATPVAEPTLAPAPPVDEDTRRKGAAVVAHAEAFANAGHLPLAARRDCSGFVLAAYRAAGQPLQVPLEDQRQRNMSAMLHDWSVDSHRAFREGSPLPGDVVFFRDTVADSSGNHVTHMALVERVGDDGTVVMIHYLSGKVRRDLMNLAHPTDPTRNGWLRRKTHAGDPALAGELFVAYARFE